MMTRAKDDALENGKGASSRVDEADNLFIG